MPMKNSNGNPAIDSYCSWHQHGSASALSWCFVDRRLRVLTCFCHLGSVSCVEQPNLWSTLSCVGPVVGLLALPCHWRDKSHSGQRAAMWWSETICYVWSYLFRVRLSASIPLDIQTTGALLKFYSWNSYFFLYWECVFFGTQWFRICSPTLHPKHMILS